MLIRVTLHMAKQQTAIWVVMMMALSALSLSAQSYIGPTIAYTVSTSLGPEVTSFGSPTRLNLGVRFNRVLNAKAELVTSLAYRMENGGFTSAFTPTTGVQQTGIGQPTQLNVVEDPTKPRTSSTLTSTSLEFNLGIAFKATELDSQGSKLMIGFGVLADRLLSLHQVDDYSAVPRDQLGTRPVTQSADYDPQFGFGATINLSLVVSLGSDRLVFDIGYMFRRPTDIDQPNSTGAKPATQDIGWLLSRGLRVGGSYLFSL